MEILLKRKFMTKSCTLGEMYINDKLFCFTLEDVIRKEKIKHQTAIDAGKYEVIINHSVRFKRSMPLLLNVPKFEGIRIHAGNTASNTSGCILIGYKVEEESISQSKKCFEDFYKCLKSYIGKEAVFIEIVNQVEEGIF